MRWIYLIPLFLLAACDPPEQGEKERLSDVAEVERAQTLPPIPIVPDMIAHADLEKHGLLGPGCHVPAGGGKNLLALVNERLAYIIVEGELERFAADPGSATLGFGVHARYSGTSRSMEWWLDEDMARQTKDGLTDYPGTLTIRDAAGAVVWAHQGPVRCEA